MRPVRLSAVFVAFAVFASACTSSGDTTADVETAATAEDGDSGSMFGVGTGTTLDVGTDDGGGTSTGLRNALTAAGIEVIDSPETVDQVNGFQLWSFQVENMEREIDVGGGVVGFDLDEMVGAPSGMPFSYLVAGWITGAGTQAAESAAEIMGDQNWEAAPSLVYPTSVLMLFVADSLLAAGVAGERSAQPQLIPVAASKSGLCTRLANWIDRALNWIFDGLRIDVVGDEWYAWAANIWNTAVNLAEKALRKAIEVVTETLLAPIQKALAVIGTVSMVVSTLKQWDYKIIPPDEAPELAVGDAPDTLATATLLVNTKLPEWPESVSDCARKAGSPLPDPSSAEDSKVTWKIGEDAYPKNLASIVDFDKTINEDNTADVTFNPGRDKGDQPFPGWIFLTATVEKDQVWKLREMLWTLLTGRVREETGETFWEPVYKIISTLTEPILDKIIKLIAESSGPKRIDVIHHSDVEFEYPIDDLETNEPSTYPVSQFEPIEPLKITYEYIEGGYVSSRVVVAWSGDNISKTFYGTDLNGFLDTPSDYRWVRGPDVRFEGFCDIGEGNRGCTPFGNEPPSKDNSALFPGGFGEVPRYQGRLPSFEVTKTREYAGHPCGFGVGVDDEFGEVELCVEEATGAVLYVHTVGRCNDPNLTDRTCVEVQAILVEAASLGEIEGPGLGDFELPAP